MDESLSLEYTLHQCLSIFDGPTNGGNWMRPTQKDVPQSSPREFHPSVATISRACHDLTDCFPDGIFYDNVTMGNIMRCEQQSAIVPRIDAVLRTSGWEGVTGDVLSNPCELVETDLPTCQCQVRSWGSDCQNLKVIGNINLAASAVTYVSLFIYVIVLLKDLTVLVRGRQSRSAYGFYIRLFVISMGFLFVASTIIWQLGFVLDMVFPIYISQQGEAIPRQYSYIGGTIASSVILIAALTVALHFIRTVAQEARLASIFASSVQAMNRTIIGMACTYIPITLMGLHIYGPWFGSLMITGYMCIVEVLFSFGYVFLGKMAKKLSGTSTSTTVSIDTSQAVETVMMLRASVLKVILVITLTLFCAVISGVVFANADHYVVWYSIAQWCTLYTLKTLYNTMQGGSRKVSPAQRKAKTVQPERKLSMESSVGTLSC